MSDKITSAGDEGQDFLGEGDDDAAGQGQEAVGTLAGIVGLEGKAHLNNAPAQQDQAHSPDEAEDELTEVVDNGQGIGGGEGGSGHERHKRDSHHCVAVDAEAPLNSAGDDGAFFGVAVFLLEQFHCLCSPSYLILLPARPG